MRWRRLASGIAGARFRSSIRHGGADRDPQRRDREAPSAPCHHPGPGAPCSRPARRAYREADVAGIVVRGHFPRRRMVLVVGTNIFRYIFRGAARNWARNMGSTAPALGSMTLLLFLSGVIGLSGLALYNLEQVEAGQASVLHVYIRDSAASADVDALWDRLAQDRRVASVALTTKAEALSGRSASRAYHSSPTPAKAIRFPPASTCR